MDALTGNERLPNVMGSPGKLLSFYGRCRSLFGGGPPDPESSERVGVPRPSVTGAVVQTLPTGIRAKWPKRQQVRRAADAIAPAWPTHMPTTTMDACKLQQFLRQPPWMPRHHKAPLELRASLQGPSRRNAWPIQLSTGACRSASAAHFRHQTRGFSTLSASAQYHATVMCMGTTCATVGVLWPSSVWGRD